MTGGLTSKAGTAMRWRAVQLAGVQAIYLVRLLILARLLAPDAFGLLAIATVALGVLGQLTELGMIPALVQRRDATMEQYDAAWTVAMLRAIVVAIVLVFAAPAVARWFGEPAATPIIQALALRPIVDAAASIGVARLMRELRFRELTFIYMPGAIVDAVVAIATARWLGVWALVAGALAGAATTALASYWMAPHRPRLVLRRAAMVPLVQFGRWVMFTGIVALAGVTIAQLVLSRIHGAEALGLYMLASKVAFLPLTAVSTVVGSVAFPLFADLYADAQRTAAAFRRLVSGQMVVLLPTYAMLLVLAPVLEDVLGPRWVGTAPVIQLLSIHAMSSVLVDTLAPLFMGKGQPAGTFVLELVQTGLLLATLWPLVLAMGVNGFAVAWLIGNVGALVLGIVWLRRLLPGERVAESMALAAACVAAVAGGAAAALCTKVLPAVPALIVGAVSGTVAALVVLVLLNRALGLDLDPLVQWVRGAIGRSEHRT